jgi:hypothetical protein
MDLFSAASALATADLATIQTPAIDSTSVPSQVPEPATAPPAEPVPEPVAPEPVVTEPVVEPQTPAEIKRELELTWRGQRIKVAEEEAISLAQKGYDYSQKTAELSKFREELATERAQLEKQAADLRNVLSDPAQLKQLVQWAAEQQPEPLDPNSGLTAQQTEQMIQQNLQVMQRQVQTDIKRAQLELETNRLEQEFTGAINGHLKATLDRHPVLQDVDGMDQLLRKEALTYQQSQLAANPHKEITLQEILGVMSKAAERQANKIEARFTNMLKAQAVKQSTVISKGIDPGGSAPIVQAAPDPRLGSKELRALVEADVRAAMSR